MNTKKIGNLILYIIVAAAILCFVFPLLFMLMGSFMGATEIQKNFSIVSDGGVSSGLYDVPHYAALHLIPDQFTLQQYYDALFPTTRFWTNFWNSIYLSLPILGGVIIAAPLCGYGLAKFRFPGKRIILFLYLILMMLPYQVTLVPNYLVLNMFNLIGSRASVILPNIFTTFGCYLVMQFAEKIPDDTLESARLDGLSEVGVYFRIALPQMKTGIAALAILNLSDTFAMVEQPLVFLQNQTKQPLSVSLTYINQSDITIAFVSGIIFIIPLLLIFLLGKDRLVQGISESVI